VGEHREGVAINMIVIAHRNQHGECHAGVMKDRLD
jgi:hypothetical protein